jgi:PLP dependent protein
VMVHPSPRPVDPDRVGSGDDVPAVELLRGNLQAVYARIEAARARSPRAAPRTTLVVVTKAAPAGAFHWLGQVGERDVGENRVADALAKRVDAPAGLVWHGIGHLQTNKVKKAVRAFDVVHAVDSAALGRALADALDAAGERRPVYAQVNAAADPRKGGVPLERGLDFLEELARMASLDVVGLMTMAKEDDVGERARPAFAALRSLRDDAVRRGVGHVPPQGLSMGMSGDFEVAVEEGATVVRVGRAIWDGVAPAPRAPDSGVARPGTAHTVSRSRT